MEYNARVEEKQKDGVLFSEMKDGVLFSEMKDGEIGVILPDQLYQNTVIQRYDNTIISVGKPSGHRWNNLGSVNLRVHILQPGDKILL